MMFTESFPVFRVPLCGEDSWGGGGCKAISTEILCGNNSNERELSTVCSVSHVNIGGNCISANVLVFKE